MNETQLIADIWESAQRFNKIQIIKMYKMKVVNLIKKRHGVVVKDTHITGDQDTNLRRLVQDVCRVFGMEQRQFLYGGRSLNVVIPRHIYHKVAYDNRIGTLKAISKFSGNLDHTTVRSSIIRATDLVFVRDEKFLRCWDKYLAEGDPYFTSIYYSQVTVRVYENNVQDLKTA